MLYIERMLHTAHLSKFPVSRETWTLLEHYVSLLQKWNRAINLIGKSTENDLWQRHIEDSLQLLPLIPSSVSSLADFGSGAGLPGIVIAIARPGIHVHLVEQDQRKAAFLQEVTANLSLSNVTIHNQDIAHYDAQVDMVTARALASLRLLCEMAHPKLVPGGICLFPKGKQLAMEIAEAETAWNFTYTTTPSTTDSQASLLFLSGLTPKSTMVTL